MAQSRKKNESDSYRVFLDQLKGRDFCRVYLFFGEESYLLEQYKKELAELLSAFDLQTVGSKKVEERRGQKGQKTIRMEAMKKAINNRSAGMMMIVSMANAEDTNIRARSSSLCAR